jgi:2-methylcitrate dehydratase PrpD
MITAIVIAYEIYHNLTNTVRVREKGMDHCFYGAVAGPSVRLRFWGLIAHALSKPCRWRSRPTLQSMRPGMDIYPCGKAAPAATRRATACLQPSLPQRE